MIVILQINKPAKKKRKFFKLCKKVLFNPKTLYELVMVNDKNDGMHYVGLRFHQHNKLVLICQLTKTPSTTIYLKSIIFLKDLYSINTNPF